MLAKFNFMQILFIVACLPYCLFFGFISEQISFALVFLAYLWADTYYKNSDPAKKWVLEKIKDMSLHRLLALQSLLLILSICYAYTLNTGIGVTLMLFGFYMSILLNEPMFGAAIRRTDISSTDWNNVFEFLKVVRDFHLLPLILYGCLVLNFNYQKSGLWWELTGVLMMIILMAFTFSTVNKINSLPNGLRSKFSEF